MDDYSPKYHLSVALDGYRLSYMSAGDGLEKLIFVHGWAASKDSWEPFIVDLSRDYACMALDLPGMGDSEPRSDGDYHVAAMADSVEGFLNALGGGPVTLVGHSTGGLIGLMLAHRRPDLVSRLVLVGSVIDGTLGPPFTPGVKVPLIWHWLMRLVWGLQTRNLRWFLLSVQPFLYDRSQAWTIPYFKRLYPYYLHYDLSGLSTLLVSLTRQDMTPYLSDIAVPTLITSGEGDRSVPPGQAEVAARLMPGARMAYVPRAAHLPQLENTPHALALVREFLHETNGEPIAPEVNLKRRSL